MTQAARADDGRARDAGRRRLLVPALLLAALVSTLGAGEAEARGNSSHPYFNDMGTLDWYTTYAGARRAAAENDRVIFVEMGRRRCSNCRAVANKTITDRSVRHRLSSVAIGLAAEADHPERVLNNKLRMHLPGARMLPLCGFLTPDGAWITGFGGYCSPHRFSRYLSEAEAWVRERREQREAAARAKAAEAAPAPTATDIEKPAAPRAEPRTDLEVPPLDAAEGDADDAHESEEEHLPPALFGEDDRGVSDEGTCEGGSCEGGQCELPELETTELDATEQDTTEIRAEPEADAPVAQLPFLSPGSGRIQSVPVAPAERRSGGSITGVPAPRPDAPIARGTPDIDVKAPLGATVPPVPAVIRPAARPPQGGVRALAEAAAGREQWGKVLQVLGDGPYADAAVAELARRAQAFGNSALDAAVDALERREIERARGLLARIAQEFAGQPISVDASRGILAIVYLEDLAALPEDSPFRRAVRLRAFDDMRGSRWAALFRYE